MQKTLLAAFIGASVFALPCFAQVSLGGAGRVGAGLNAGTGALNGAMRTPGQLEGQVEPTLRHADRHARHANRQATGQARSTLDRHGKADAAVGGSASADAAGHHVGTGAHRSADVDAGAMAQRATTTTRGVGHQVSDAAHAANERTDRTAGSVGDAARQSATSNSVGADAKVRAKADEHGH